MKRKYLILILLFPALSLIFFNGLFPFVNIIVLSFFDYSLVKKSFDFISFNNYIQLTQDTVFLNSLFSTFKFLIATVAIEFPIGFALAYLLAEQFKGRNIFRALICLPLALAPIEIGMLWKLILNPDVGIVVYTLRNLFGFNLNIAVSSAQAFWATVLMDVWHWTPFIALVLLGGLLSISKVLYESAELDGAGFFNKFRYITLPNMKIAFALVAILRVSDIIKIYDEIRFLTNGGPGMTTRYLSMQLVEEAIMTWNLGYAASMSLIVLIIIALLANLFLKTMRMEKL